MSSMSFSWSRSKCAIMALRAAGRVRNMPPATFGVLHRSAHAREAGAFPGTSSRGWASLRELGLVLRPQAGLQLRDQRGPGRRVRRLSVEETGVALELA